MKLMAVMIAVLFLISTTWAQGQSTENGKESGPMPTMKLEPKSVTVVSVEQ